MVVNRPPGVTALGNSFNERREEEPVYGGSWQGGSSAEDPPLGVQDVVSRSQSITSVC